MGSRSSSASRVDLWNFIIAKVKLGQRGEGKGESDGGDASARERGDAVATIDEFVLPFN